MDRLRRRRKLITPAFIPEIHSGNVSANAGKSGSAITRIRPHTLLLVVNMVFLFIFVVDPESRITIGNLLESRLAMATSTVDKSPTGTNTNPNTNGVSSQALNEINQKIASALAPPKRPFQMPILGGDSLDTGFQIFQPTYDLDFHNYSPMLIQPPLKFIASMKERIEYEDTLIIHETSNDGSEIRTSEERAQDMYLQMIKNMVSGTALNTVELSSTSTRDDRNDGQEDEDKSQQSTHEFKYGGDTTIGWKRLDNIQNIIQNVIKNNIVGDYVETGVWRGGTSVLARAAMNSLGGEDRLSYVCDTFQGEMKDNKKNLKRAYLQVSPELVANNFVKYGLLDSNIIFARGLLKDTMPTLSKHIQSLSVIRHDTSTETDLYESTATILYHLYDKVSIGGYVIIDDWFGSQAKIACEQFFDVHEIQPEVIPIDKYAVYWQKKEQVEIEYWRYKQKQFIEGQETLTLTA
jgi:O-methyltransferase